MRKNNIDSHYNHKLNQYGNCFILELNKMVYNHFQNEYEKPHKDNDIVFSKGMTKISVDDKGAIPLGEPGLPVRSNACKLNASLCLKSNKEKKGALDHNFFRANICPTITLFIKTPFNSKSWRKGLVTACLKEGVTQQSSAMRHAAELTQQIQQILQEQEDTTMPYSFLIRSDGGNDRNPKILQFF